MCLSTGPCSITTTACQQPCAKAENSAFDLLADGTIRPRSDHSQCLMAATAATEDGNVTLGACGERVPLNAMWLNQTTLSNGVYVGACARLQFGRSVPRSGICFNIRATGQWELLNGAPVASGQVNGTAVGVWHTIQLTMSGEDVTASIDGSVVATVKGAAAKFPMGTACLESGYNVAYFDNVSLK